MGLKSILVSNKVPDKQNVMCVVSHWEYFCDQLQPRYMSVIAFPITDNLTAFQQLVPINKPSNSSNSELNKQLTSLLNYFEQHFMTSNISVNAVRHSGIGPTNIISPIIDQLPLMESPFKWTNKNKAPAFIMCCLELWENAWPYLSQTVYIKIWRLNFTEVFIISRKL